MTYDNNEVNDSFGMNLNKFFKNDDLFNEDEVLDANKDTSLKSERNLLASYEEEQRYNEELIERLNKKTTDIQGIKSDLNGIIDKGLEVISDSENKKKTIEKELELKRNNNNSDLNSIKKEESVITTAPSDDYDLDDSVTTQNINTKNTNTENTNSQNKDIESIVDFKDENIESVTDSKKEDTTEVPITKEASSNIISAAESIEAPISKEERKTLLYKEKAEKEKAERDKLALEEALKEKQAEIDSLKSKKKKKSIISLFTKANDDSVKSLELAVNESKAQELQAKKEKTKKDILSKPIKRDRDLSEDTLKELALYDQKLHCKNANAFDLEVDKSRIPTKDSFVIIYCDVNNLKKINDSIGHEGGDALLTACSGKMMERFTKDQVYRIGGDEFNIIYHPTSDSKPVNEQIEEDLKALEKINPLYSFSYGFAVSDSKKTIGELQKEADSKMYSYKESYKKAHNNPVDSKIKKVNNILDTLIRLIEDSENICNIFIKSKKNTLFIIQHTGEFYNYLEDDAFIVRGESQIEYCVITFTDSEDYVIYTEDDLDDPNPYELFEPLDKEIKCSRIGYIQMAEVRRHKELSVFKQVFMG